MTTPNETIIKYLTDMHAVEHHLAHTLKNQVKDEDLGHFPEANSLIKRLLARTETALSALELQIEGLGAESRGSIKDTVTAATGAVLGAIGHTRTHHVSKMLRDDYATLSLISISYELLHATGNALESPQVASLSLSHLKTVAGFIVELSQVIIPVAVEELGKTNSIDASTITVSQANIKGAWQTV